MPKTDAIDPEGQNMKRLLPAVTLVALLAACGSASSSTNSSPSAIPSVAASTPAPTPTATPTAAALAQLQTAVLQATDMPAGWTGTAYKDDPSGDTTNAEIAACVGVPNTDPNRVAKAHSDDFALGDATISASVNSYRSQSDIDTDLAMLTSPKVSPCFEQSMKTSLATAVPADATIEVSFTVTPGAAGGPSNVIAIGAGSATVTSGGQKTAIYFTTAFITGTLIEADVSASNVGSPVPDATLSPLIGLVAQRVAAL